MSKQEEILENLHKLLSQNEVNNKKQDRILENQEIIIKQLLFVLDYMIGDDEKREEIKRNLLGLFDEPTNKKRRAI